MRAFSTAWPKRAIVQEALAQLSWYQNLVLLEKLKTPEHRLWYAAKAYEYGWSRNILAMQIEVQAHLRFGKAQFNFYVKTIGYSSVIRNFRLTELQSK